MDEAHKKKIPSWKLLGLSIFVGFTLGLSSIATADQGIVEVEGLGSYAWRLGNLEEGDKITWDIRTDVDDVDLYITTYNEYRKYTAHEQWAYYEGSPRIYQDKGTYTVTFADSWVFLVINPNFKAVRVTYELDVTSPVIPGIPGFTLAPAIIGLGVLGAVAAVRKRQSRSH